MQLLEVRCKDSLMARIHGQFFEHHRPKAPGFCQRLGKRDDTYQIKRTIGIFTDVHMPICLWGECRAD